MSWTFNLCEFTRLLNASTDNLNNNEQENCQTYSISIFCRSPSIEWLQYYSIFLKCKHDYLLFIHNTFTRVQKQMHTKIKADIQFRRWAIAASIENIVVFSLRTIFQLQYSIFLISVNWNLHHAFDMQMKMHSSTSCDYNYHFSRAYFRDEKWNFTGLKIMRQFLFTWIASNSCFINAMKH